MQQPPTINRRSGNTAPIYQCFFPKRKVPLCSTHKTKTLWTFQRKVKQKQMAFLKPTLFPRISFISPPSPSSSPCSKLKDLNIRAPPLQARAAWTVFLLPSLWPYPAVSSSSLQSLAAQHTITDDLPDLPLVLCTTHFLPYDPCPAMATSRHQQLAPLSSAVFPLECSFRRLGRPKRVETSCNLTRRANSVQQNLLQNPFLISVFESAPSSQTMISCSSQSTPTILFLPHWMRDLIPWLFNSLRTSSDTTADTSSL